MIVEDVWGCVKRRLATMQEKVPQGVCNGQEFCLVFGGQFLVFSSQCLVFGEQQTAVASGQWLVVSFWCLEVIWVQGSGILAGSHGEAFWGGRWLVLAGL